MPVFSLGRSLLWCLVAAILLNSRAEAGTVCRFEFIQARTSPGRVSLEYSYSGIDSILCKIEDEEFIDCPNGTSFEVETSGVYTFNFNLTCIVGSLPPGAAGPYPINVPGPCPTVETTRLRRRSNYDQYRKVTYLWNVAGGDVEQTCQFDNDQEFPCQSPFRVTKSLYDSLCSKRHTFTVRAYCSGKELATASNTVRLFTGVACKPGCSDITFSTVPTITDKTTTSGGSRITTNFRTSVRSRCNCQELREKSFKPCSSGSSTAVSARSGVFVISCEARDGCNTIIRHYLPF